MMSHDVRGYGMVGLMQAVFLACTSGLLGGLFFFYLIKNLQAVPNTYRPRPTKRKMAEDEGEPRFFVSRRDTTFSMSNEDGSNVEFRGWSMQDALEQAEKSKLRAAAMTPEEVLHSLQKGNSRFWTGRSSRPEISAFERRVLIATQFPQVAILGCSDSRVPVEIVFDQGLGDMFVVRVAGNCLGQTTTASLQYAIHHLHVKVLIIMGHEGCGAVKTAALPLQIIEKEPDHLAGMLKEIKKGLDQEILANIHDVRARDREAVTSNVRRQVERICSDDSTYARVKSGNLVIIGGFYELSSGIVDFFHEVAHYGKDDCGQPSPGVRSRYFPESGRLVRG